MRGKPGFPTLESSSGRETDSPLEGDGFELSVPGRGIRPFGSSPHWPGGTGISNLRPLAGWISTLERGWFQGHKQKRKLKLVAPRAEPKVRIHLPPAGSPVR